MKDNQKLILKDMQETYQKLQNILVNLMVENSITQFDFCSSAELENITSNIESAVGRIVCIVYQK